VAINTAAGFICAFGSGAAAQRMALTLNTASLYSDW